MIFNVESSLPPMQHGSGSEFDSEQSMTKSVALRAAAPVATVARIPTRILTVWGFNDDIYPDNFIKLTSGHLGSLCQTDSAGCSVQPVR